MHLNGYTIYLTTLFSIDIGIGVAVYIYIKVTDRIQANAQLFSQYLEW
jgi:hypothetical protein